MSEPERQLALDLPHDVSMSRADFLIGKPNEAAARLIDAFPDWPNPVVLLIGPAGSGKTHLAGIWRSASGAMVIEASKVGADAIDQMPMHGRVLVEDIDRSTIDEAGLFHLLNLVRERGGHALLTSREPVSDLRVALPDLVSRLRAALPAVLLTPDDDLLSRVIRKLFSDRQLSVDPSVIEYLGRRMERSFAAAGRLVAELDSAALEERRPITRQLAASVLERLGGGEPELPLFP